MGEHYTRLYSFCNTLSHNSMVHSKGMAISDILTGLLRARGENPHSLSLKCGVPQPTIARIASGDSKEPKRSNLIKIARALGVKPDIFYDDVVIKSGQYLSILTGVQRLAGSPELTHSNADEAPALGRMLRVPVVGTAQLGDNGFWVEIEAPVGFGDGFVEFAAKDKDAYALRCRGDSMKPRIKDGEFVIIEPSHAPAPGDEVLVRAKDGRVMVKELLYVRNDTVHLLSVNETHGRISIPVADIDIMQFVSGISKSVMWRQD